MCQSLDSELLFLETSQQSYGVNIITTPILEISKPRFRKAMKLAQGYTARKLRGPRYKFSSVSVQGLNF